MAWYDTLVTQLEALTILKTGANVFLTGSPGAGKTYTLNQYIEYLKSHQLEVAVTASTGIAATHIGGMTIHSWSGIGIRSRLTPYDLENIISQEYVVKRVRKAHVLVIDEISMLSCETLESVDRVCKEIRQNQESFGGLQVIFVGDFFQLPPIVKKQQVDLYNQDEDYNENCFAYMSTAWREASPLVCYITEQHRQEDETLLEILDAMRRNEYTQEHTNHLEKRRVVHLEKFGQITKLFTHNIDVDKVNDEMLSGITAPEYVFHVQEKGKPALLMALKKGCLSPEILKLKVGAQVVCTKNNPQKGYVNGTLATVVGFESGSRYPIIETKEGDRISMEQADWSIDDNGKVLATISQIPLRLAWAITIHKSQGMSLDEAVMDLSNVFEYGQGYVALSRVRSLTGLHLVGWNSRSLEVHPVILEKDIIFKQQSESALDAFSRIPQEEVVSMQENFIKAHGGVLDPVNTSVSRSVRKMDTKNITLVLWHAGKTISEIAAERNLKDQTIFDHVESLIKEGKISVDEVRRLMSSDLDKALSTIHKVFKKLDTDKLTPVFEALKGKYSYDDLRIARMLLHGSKK